MILLVAGDVGNAAKSGFEEWFLIYHTEAIDDPFPVLFDSTSEIPFEATGGSTDEVNSFCFNSISSDMVIDEPKDLILVLTLKG